MILYFFLTVLMKTSGIIHLFSSLIWLGMVVQNIKSGKCDPFLLVKFSFINIFKCHIILVILVSPFPQAQTMQMMYEIIAAELKSMHLESSHPQDYLNFYCLGNREELPKEASPSPNQSSKNGDTVSYTFFFPF